MDMSTQQQSTSAPTLDPATQMGLVALGVADLSRSLAFYTEAFGFAVLEHAHPRATLGVGSTPLLLLNEEPGARPWPHDRYGYTGLYHFAILVPSRVDLGRWLSHWLAAGYAMPGQGDHLVSEALYLTDPDGNGIEIYRDRPRAEWQWDSGRVRMAVDPVDIQGLLTEAARHDDPWQGLAAGTRLGHMHLQVGDIAQAEAFYHGILGFDVVAAMPSALFISAGGYHHHIGMNIWHSRGADPAPTGIAGLRFYTIELPSQDARAAVVNRLRAAGVEVSAGKDVVGLHDPWSNTVFLTVGAADLAAAEHLMAAIPLQVTR
jgi:catechol 2,3-dioxygenase